MGAIRELGGFSLNYHKTIQPGEGGVIVANDDKLAQRLSLIRNHGEMVVESLEVEDLANTLGGNLRMTEIEAAIALEQLRKLQVPTRPRIDFASYLNEPLPT